MKKISYFKSSLNNWKLSNKYPLEFEIHEMIYPLKRNKDIVIMYASDTLHSHNFPVFSDTKEEHRKKVLNLLRLTDNFGLSRSVYKRISLSFSKV